MRALLKFPKGRKKDPKTSTMRDNEIFEMDSVTETEEMEGDPELGMIDEEVGE